MTAIEFGAGLRPLLIIGGCHGDEPKSVILAQRLAEVLESRPNSHTARAGIVVLANLNPDGHLGRRRRNANRVDLNRNFPTRNWTLGKPRSRFYGGSRPASEPETRALIRLIGRIRPRAIVTIHSIDRHRHCNNYDGPARSWAMVLSRFNGYPVRRSIGYATPGSFGTWAGRERRIPTVTLELPSHHSLQRCVADNLPALIMLAGIPRRLL